MLRLFQYSFSAGRSPNGRPDRYVEQAGDAAGVVRGSYSYLDPNWEWQKVSYVADDLGFHVEASNLPVANPVAHPQARLYPYRNRKSKHLIHCDCRTRGQ